jgi:hypothetical protein
MSSGRIKLLLAVLLSVLAISLWVKRPQRTAQPPPGEAGLLQAHIVQTQPEREPRSKRPRTKTPATRHEPEQPKTGEPVLVTVQLEGSEHTSGVFLEYQVVEPGKYVALNDARYARQWTQISLNDRGKDGDKAAGDGLFSAVLPSSLQQHRRLVRYRIRSSQDRKLIAPDPSDLQPNFAYFVYDGVPPWKGAINPRARDATLRKVVAYSPEALERVPVYHFISHGSSVRKVMWEEPSHLWSGDRHEYRYTGTMVYEGKVYDHIGFRARGGQWRHAMGKNMLKFNFLPGHRFEARDHYGRAYNAKWDKLNLGACIQQGDYGMRGEAGMFEAVGFRLFNLAGIEAPHTHWVHLRIITDAKENPADQYSGDFWGLYLATENVDEHFLKEHQLGRGNLYKIESPPKTAFNGNRAISRQEDLLAFTQALARRPQADSWWFEHVDLGRYYNYRAIVEAIHHYDIGFGKNYFYYLHPDSQKWVVIPWDIDLSWADQMFGNGNEPFHRTGILSRAPFKEQYQQRLAEIRDLLFNPDQTWLLIDEHAAMISDPGGGPSLVQADRAKWDYHPVLASRHVNAAKAGQGRFYFGNARNGFDVMIDHMKSYAAQRARWIDSMLLADYHPPGAPIIIAPTAPNGARDLQLRFVEKPAFAVQKAHWRLAEVTDPKSRVFDPGHPWKYEINSIWEKETGAVQSVEAPADLFSPGKRYRARARWQDQNGRWSRWSAPVEFVTP